MARGHEVTLFATGDSETSAELRYFFERGYEDDEEVWDWQFTEYMHVGHAYACAEEFDVIHCHSDHFGLPFAPFVATPNIHTPTSRWSPRWSPPTGAASGIHLVAVSNFRPGAMTDARTWS